ncbi:YceH family protein [Arenimonas composti]|uniref:Uncharacterized protein n=1 Tax=Arenimonas composti TR7-09 = DSM 18010 TaxID=1121013 RepID=A0A091BFD3_9GAMM|nr:DUF480 domain-containing protein [Arenimonas composti]KFN50267.1 hypothetical protein P873_07875 [Arenimonas composti TR7-09 = DSM 18010]
MSEITGTAEVPQLSPTEARILGSLVEKEATTPEAYPLTANAVTLACNQKNNREPVLELEPGEVGHALRELESRRLVRSLHGARAQRYEHRLAEAYSLTRAQQALLALLLLRGAQTVAELHARSERLAKIADLEETRQVLERLAQRGIVANLGRGPGQREDRWMHLLCGPVELADLPPPRASRGRDQDDGDARDDTRAARIDALEARVEALEAQVAGLVAALGGG